MENPMEKARALRISSQHCRYYIFLENRGCSDHRNRWNKAGFGKHAYIRRMPGRIHLIRHPESYEDETVRRRFMGRMTRKQAELAAKTFAGRGVSRTGSLYPVAAN